MFSNYSPHVASLPRLQKRRETWFAKKKLDVVICLIAVAVSALGTVGCDHEPKEGGQDIQMEGENGVLRMAAFIKVGTETAAGASASAQAAVGPSGWPGRLAVVGTGAQAGWVSTATILYAHETNDRIYVIDGARGELSVVDRSLRKGITVPIESGCANLALDRDGRNLYVTCPPSGRLLLLDPFSLEVRDTIRVCAGASTMAVGPGGQRIYVGCPANREVALLVNTTVHGARFDEGRLLVAPQGKGKVEVRGLDGNPLWQTDRVAAGCGPWLEWSASSDSDSNESGDAVKDAEDAAEAATKKETEDLFLMRLYRNVEVLGEPEIWGDGQIAVDWGLTALEVDTGVVHTISFSDVLKETMDTACTTLNAQGAVDDERFFLPLPALGELVVFQRSISGSGERAAGGAHAAGVHTGEEVTRQGTLADLVSIAKRTVLGGSPVAVATFDDEADGRLIVFDAQQPRLVLLDRQLLVQRTRALCCQ